MEQTSNFAEYLGATPERVASIVAELDADDRVAGRLTCDVLTDVWLALVADAGPGNVVEAADGLWNLPIRSDSDTLEGLDIQNFGELLAAHIFDPFPGLDRFAVVHEDGGWVAAAIFDTGVVLFEGPAWDADAPSLISRATMCDGQALTALMEAAEGVPEFAPTQTLERLNVVD